MQFPCLPAHSKRLRIQGDNASVSDVDSYWLRFFHTNAQVMLKISPICLPGSPPLIDYYYCQAILSNLMTGIFWSQFSYNLISKCINGHHLTTCQKVFLSKHGGEEGKPTTGIKRNI